MTATHITQERTMDSRIVTETHPSTRRHPALTTYAIDGNLIAVGLGTVADHREVFDPCKRCGWGLGHHQFNGMDSDCYLCGGAATGSPTSLDDAVRRYDARSTRQAREAAKRAAKAREEAHEAALWFNEHMDVVAALEPFEYRGGFTGDMARTVAESRPLTPKQLAAVVAGFEKMAEVAASHKHWGRVGERAEVTAVVSLARSLPDNGFGPSMLVKLETGEAETLVTFTTAAWAWEANEGDVYTGKATVKKHDEYNGVPQTVITRAKFERVSDTTE